MRQTLNVEAGSYEIVLTDENIDKTFEDLKAFIADKKSLFVVSQKVYKLYKEELSLNKLNSLVLKDGEKEKNFCNYTKILKRMAELELSRKDVLVALGGGVVGDITGFAAASYMRGINYIQVPTTLLAMVDSSVGGKTAIDLDGIKNIVGAFYQPEKVFINVNFIKTLDERQFRSGLGEVLKYAFIEDDCGYQHPLFLFEYLTLCAEKLLERDIKTLMRVIEHSLLLKISVVNQDEKEAGLRKILNLGHTYGHALETLGGYKKYLHGEAVIQGLFFIFNYAYANRLINYSHYRLSTELLMKYGFKSQTLKYKPSKFVEIMKKDKKAQQDKITFVVPTAKKKVREIDLTPSEVQEMF